MNRKELSAAIAEAAARTERAAALQRESIARAEAARAKQEEAIVRQEAASAKQEEAIARQEAASVKQEEALARQEAATARLNEIESDAAERNKKLDGLLEEMRTDRARREAEWEDEKRWREEFLRRQEKMFQGYLERADETLAQIKLQTAEIIAELQDHRDERRALKEAILKLMDRLPPPPPPHLRSA